MQQQRRERVLVSGAVVSDRQIGPSMDQAVSSGLGPRALAAPASVEGIYRSEYSALVRMAATVTQNLEDAQDVVQDAFVGLQRNWSRLTDRNLILGYLRVSVLNGARSLFRRRATAYRHPFLDSDVAPGADAPVLLRDEYRLVVMAVRKLPRRQFLCVALRYWADMADAEIAAVLGVSQVAVRSNVSRGLRAVAEQFEVKR